MIPCRESADQRPVLLLGVGNVLFADEGAGVHALRRLSGEFRETQALRCIDGGTLGLALVDDVGRSRALIVLDAAELGRPPGSVVVFEGEAMDRFLGGRSSAGAHELGLLDALAAAAFAGALPARRALVGIQGECFEACAAPGRSAAGAIDAACESAREFVRRWL